MGQHDRNLLKMKEKLLVEKAASEQQVIDAKNDESKSRLTAATAKEKLKVFGVSEEQIELLTKNLGDAPMPEELHIDQRQGADDAPFTRGRQRHSARRRSGQSVSTTTTCS